MKNIKRLLTIIIVGMVLLGGIPLVNAASLVPGSALCSITNGSVDAKVNTDLLITKFHFVIFRPASTSISNEQWGGFNQQIFFSQNGITLTTNDSLLIWDDRYTMYEQIHCY